MAKTYSRSEEFRLLCGKLDGLALLPLAMVPEGMRYIKSIATSDAEPLVDYFDQTYVSGSWQMQRIDDGDSDEEDPDDPKHLPPMRLRLRPPIFPPPL